MVALPNIELSYGTDMSMDVRVKRVDFGDGYSQRSLDGLNAVRQQWRLVWERIPDAQAEELRLFFKSLGAGVVDWTPFNQPLPLKWSASGFTSKPVAYIISTASVTLTQEFDL